MKTSSPKLIRHLLSLSSMTMLSRVLGMVRDVLIATFFGAGAMTDAFVLALRIPNMFRSFFAEGAFSQAFVPILAKVQHNSPNEEHTFINNSFALLALCSGVLSVLGSLFSPHIASMFALGYDDTQTNVVASLLAITFPYIFFVSLTALCAAVLHCHQHFFVPALAPVLVNVCLILAALFFAGNFSLPVESLAWGLIVAGIVQLLIQFFPLARIKKIPRPKLSFKNPHITRVFILMVPIILSASVVQISTTIDSILATFLEIGSVSWLYFSHRLIGLPLGVLGVSIAVVVLPSLSRLVVQNNKSEYTRTLGWGLHMIFCLGLPATVALLALSEQIITTLFQYDRFTVTDVLQTSLALRMYIIGVIPFMLIKLFMNSFLAHGDAKTVLYCLLATSITNIVISILAMLYIGFWGLALATSISALIHALLMYAIALRNGYCGMYAGALVTALRLAFACAVLGIFLFWFRQSIDVWLEYSLLQRAFFMAVLVTAGTVCYFGSLLLSGWRWRTML